MGCAVCRRALNRRTDADGNFVRFEHGFPVDPPHEPVPIPEPDMDQGIIDVCDFCTTDGPEWSYPVEESVYDPGGMKESEDAIVMVPPADYVAHDDYAWLACTPCHELIRDGKYDALAKRSVDANPYMPEALRHNPFARMVVVAELSSIHRHFAENRAGEPASYSP